MLLSEHSSGDTLPVLINKQTLQQGKNFCNEKC